MLECLVEGEISDRISAADRGLQYGDGLFETMAVFQGTPRFWQGHMDRLALGCEHRSSPLRGQDYPDPRQVRSRVRSRRGSPDQSGRLLLGLAG